MLDDKELRGTILAEAFYRWMIRAIKGASGPVNLDAKVASIIFFYEFLRRSE
jgi:hypothetical protein